MRRRLARPAAAAVAAALLGACGYRIAGLGGELPGGIRRVEVPVFENRTVRSDMGRVLTNAFIAELVASGKVEVAREADAQAVVRGTVTGYKVDPITFDAKQKPLENRLTLVLDVALVPRGSERALLGERGVTVRQDFPVGADLQETDRNEEQARANAARLMSQKVVGLMLEGF